jgi:hypothetical protein
VARTSRNNQLGVVGGILIALAALMTGTGFALSTSGLKAPATLVLFAAGLGVTIFLLMGKLNWAVYATIAAATLLLIDLLTLVMVDGAEITLRLVILAVGVILALLATTWHHRR